LKQVKQPEKTSAPRMGETSMTHLVEGYFRLLKMLIALLLAGMIVLVFGNVVLRYAFGSGITVSEELARWFFVWLVFLGAIIGIREHAHLGVDTVLRMVGPNARKACYILSHVLMIGCSLLIIQGSWLQTKINWSVSAPATGLSVGWFYGIGLVFGASATLIQLYELYRVLTGQVTGDDLIAIKESEDH
jgi:TRAP-type transport system small permease protein